MSRIPCCSNELSPWPRIEFSDTANTQYTTLPQLRRPSSRPSDDAPEITKFKGKVIDDATSKGRNTQLNVRRTSFGSTQRYKADKYGSLGSLDRKISGQNVKSLLQFRKQKLKEAGREGDAIEIHRLKNLNLFDDMEQHPSEGSALNKKEFVGGLTGRDDHINLALQIDAFGSEFTPHPKYSSHGHSAVFCWHLKVQAARGKAIPEEFARCKLHPSPSTGVISSCSSPTLLPGSPNSNVTRNTWHLPSTGSSTFIIPSEISSSTKWSWVESGQDEVECITAKVSSDPISPGDRLSLATDSDDEDPFLYIAKHIHDHAKGAQSIDSANSLKASALEDISGRKAQPSCTCSNHDCRTYLSGGHSKHCGSCKIPGLQPEVAAAVERIDTMKRMILEQEDGNEELKGLFKDDGMGSVALQEDLKLVEMYNAEMERRCADGVWWEGWLIVEDLKRWGVVGSELFVYDRADTDV